MQTQPQELPQKLKNTCPPCIWLTGPDLFLLNQSLKFAKEFIRKTHSCEEEFITIQSADDWMIIKEKGNSYTLFSEYTLIIISSDKKTLDSTAKKIVSDYLCNYNSKCFLIINTPNIPAKQLQWLLPIKEVLFIVHYSLNNSALKQWISMQLKGHGFIFDASIVELIQQHTQGNMLACAQVIEKLSLLHSESTLITHDHVQVHLYNQCEHNLFELVDALLIGNASRSLQIIRYALINKTEVTLVLWVITQEIRYLLQIQQQLKQGVAFLVATKELKIRPHRNQLYQNAIKRISIETLQKMLHFALIIDEQIKSGLVDQAWLCLERATLSLCDTSYGDLCTL